MTIEDNIFKRYLPNFEELKQYGFIENKNYFKIEKFFKDNLFKAVITINSKGYVTGIVYDIENADEFLPLRIENNQGAFVCEIKAEYEKLLIDIRDKCFIKQYYIYPQSNRITNLIIEKYGNKPEFLWEKFQGSGIFRNPETKKWYAAILDVEGRKINQNKKGIIEVIDLKLNPKHVEEIVKTPNFYEGYHMNKKYWITIILDDSVSDNEIMELVEESHSHTLK